MPATSARDALPNPRDGLSAGDVSTVSVDHAVSIEPFLADQIEVR